MLEAYFLDLGWLLFALFFGVAMGSLTWSNSWFSRQ